MASEGTVQQRDVCLKIGSGATPRGGKDAYKGGATSLIRSQNIYNERFHRDGLVYIDNTQSAELRNVEVKPGDVLLNITGDSVARCCQVALDILPARVNQHVAIIRPQPDSLDAQFLRYILVSHEYQMRLLALASAGATRPALTKSMIEELDISLPPLAEQKAIASVLGALDDKIELNRRMNATPESMARALFPDSFEDSPFGKIPLGWTVTDIGSFAINHDARREPVRENQRKSGPYPYYGASGIVDHVDGYLFDGEFLLVAEDGENLRTRKTPVAFRATGQFWVNNHAHVITGPTLGGTRYLLLALERADIGGYLTGSTIPKLSQQSMNRISFVSPSSELLDVFQEITSPMFERIDQNEHNSTVLATLRDTLLPKLLSGELSVANAEHTM